MSFLKRCTCLRPELPQLRRQLKARRTSTVKMIRGGIGGKKSAAPCPGSDMRPGCLPHPSILKTKCLNLSWSYETVSNKIANPKNKTFFLTNDYKNFGEKSGETVQLNRQLADELSENELPEECVILFLIIRFKRTS